MDKYIDLGFKYLIDTLYSAKVVFAFLAIATMIYWFFLIAGTPFDNFLTPVIVWFIEFTKHFVDFSFDLFGEQFDVTILVTVLCHLLYVGLFDLMAKILDFVKNKILVVHDKVKLSNQNKFNQKLQRDFYSETNKNNRFIVKISVDAIPFMQGLDSTTEAERYKKELFSLLRLDGAVKTIPLSGSILFYYDDFKQIDSVVAQVKKICTELIISGEQNRFDVKFYIAIEAYETMNSAVLSYLNSMSELKIQNKVITSGVVNLRYSSLAKKEYDVKVVGTYTINGEDDNIYVFENKYQL